MSDFWPVLKIGATLARFQTSGNYEFEMETLNKCNKGDISKSKHKT